MIANKTINLLIAPRSDHPRITPTSAGLSKPFYTLYIVGVNFRTIAILRSPRSGRLEGRMVPIQRACI
jgi:hypothetical protein